ncbi:ferritin-like domain-containing protein [Denitromonas halophila]|uniref:Ferritin-like domain-containing protein n=1 Tax=Denitromonas halophila TaxID=1629404 RepID=A0A557QZY9_9RHOO|nr:ferritin-like domain-containing protein [Denitromonas halophila]TVO58479.1 ferritin-like domain-containing protein [Denitromonas halophila]
MNKKEIDLSLTRVERRLFLKNSSLFALGATAAIGLAAPGRALAGKMKMSETDDLAILNVALGLEYQAIAAYQVGAESGLLQKPVLDVAVKFQGHHKAHADVLAGTIEKLGGKPVMAMRAENYQFPVTQLKEQADVLRFAAGLEKGAASAYLGAVPQFSNRELARAAASILGDETMHWAILLNALGEDPVPAAFIA